MLEDKIKLYVNKDFVLSNLSYMALLYPFWGEVSKRNTPYEKSVWKHGFNKRYFELVTSIEAADYVFMPHDYWQLKKQYPRVLENVVREALAHKKPILVDASGDVAGRVNVPNARILRINQYRFDLPEDEITVPVPCEDLLESYCFGKIPIRTKRATPVIGFVGWGRLSFSQRIRSLVKGLPYRLMSIFDDKYSVYRKGVFWREWAIDVFKKSNKIETNFVVRSSYSGHSGTLAGDPGKNRREFVDNIINSDYTLVVRGDANIATRFYETLSLGRMPVVIDTACVFPLEDRIKYEEFCLFVDYKDIKRAPEILSDFHKQMSPERFVDIQKKARYTFENYLRYDTFSRYLVDILRRFQLKRENK